MDFDLPAALRDAAGRQHELMLMETRGALAWEYAEARGQLSDSLKERLDWADGEAPEKLDAARAAGFRARAAFAPAMQGFDALLTPSAPGEAPRGLHSTGEPVFNQLWTLLWGPCVTMPAGVGPNGLPLGAQLVGAAGDDARVLATARWLERVLG